ncbi:MAG: TolC family protein [Leptolyngbyaceae cyanobacterium SM1_1_3]|nr:TolC family protein [Leptolyngbyaceae cyanobacterium SM1_1_3]NJN02194.1 TolC family protein [Leptolyngbyaceae cyanobacterium RM1_1_2]NJO10347.1 TolC family protein [Leptolyngbyaceae cyanobacterium SL_1_1]
MTPPASTTTAVETAIAEVSTTEPAIAEKAPKSPQGASIQALDLSSVTWLRAASARSVTGQSEPQFSTVPVDDSVDDTIANEPAAEPEAVQSGAARLAATANSPAISSTELPIALSRETTSTPRSQAVADATETYADNFVPIAQALPQLEPVEPDPIDGNLEPEIVPIEGEFLPGNPTATPEDAPEALYADPNPLLYPTQTDEVEIIGTQPITLTQAIELAYRNNEDLQIALLELERSQSALREAQAALYPTLSAGSDLTARQSTSFGASGLGTTVGGITPSGGQFSTQEELQTTLSGDLDLSYNLYTSGRRSASIRSAEEQIRFNQLEVERRRAELRLNTTNDYYDLQEADEQIRINQSFLDEAQRNLEDTQLREEVGVGTRFDVLRAEVQAANARQSLVQSFSQKQIAQRQLARRLNLPSVLTVDSVPSELASAWPLSLEESIILAFQNRAELEQQLIQREISQQQRRIALSNLGPQVSLFANYSLSNTLDNDDGFEDTYSLGARVSISLFEGGQAAAQAAQRERDAEIAEVRFSETRNSIRFQVEQAFSNLEANLSNVRTARLAADQAAEALDLARLRFNAGVGTQLDVLSAQSDLTEAQGNLVTAVLGYNRALASLERSVTNLPESASLDELF